MHDSASSQRGTSIASQLLTLLGIILLCFSIGQLCGLLVTHLVFGITQSEMQVIVTDPEHSEGSRTIILFLRTVSSIFSFILLPLLFVRFRPGRLVYSSSIGSISLAAFHWLQPYFVSF